MKDIRLSVGALKIIQKKNFEKRKDYLSTAKIYPHLSFYDILKTVWTSLDTLLAKITEEFLNDLPDYVKTFKTNLQSYITDSFEDVATDQLLSGFPTLMDQQDIAKLSKAAVLSIMKYRESSVALQEKGLTIAQCFAGELIGYESLRSLLTIMSREKALEYAKKFVSEFCVQRRGPPKEAGGMEVFIQNWVDLWKDNWEGYLDFTAYILNEKQGGAKITNCATKEIAKSLDVEDKEFFYLVLCYRDFPEMNTWYKNIRFTRTKTLFQGDAYCDFCWHDIRYAPDTPHPDEKFWERL